MEIPLERGESVMDFAREFHERPQGIEVVGGSQPYVWIGSLGNQGPCFATLPTAGMRKLRDAITKALKHSRKDDD